MIPESFRQIILEKVQPLHPVSVAVFGSYARGNQTSASDLDILIDTNSHFNILDLIGIEQELSEALGVQVDLVTKRSLSPHFKPHIEKNLMQLM